MEETQLLLAHMDDLARRAAKAGWAVSRFLTPAQQGAVSRAFTRRRDVALVFEGGFENAQRRVAIFTEPQWGDCPAETALAALELGFRRQDTLGHRDILGALMALGVQRDVLGDIEAQNPAYVVCTPPVAAFLAENLAQAGRVGLKVRQVPLDTLPRRTEKVREIRDTVASLRLDGLVAAAFNLSRGEAAQCIRLGRVQLEHAQCLDVARTVGVGEQFSLRSEGKAVLMEIGGKSKKDRLWVTLGRYE